MPRKKSKRNPRKKALNIKEKSCEQKKSEISGEKRGEGKEEEKEIKSRRKC